MLSSVPTYDLYGESRTERPDFWLHCETIASRSSTHHWEIGLHRHESFQQFLYIRAGSGDAVLPGATLALVPPCIVAVPPRVSHGFRFSRDIDGLVITLVAERLRLTAGLAKRPGDWLSRPRMIALTPGEELHYLDETFSRLFAEFEAQRPGRNDLIEAYLTAAILILGRAVQPDAGGAVRDPKLARVEALKELIGRHFREQRPAEAYAALLHVSPTHLNRIVREVTAMSVHDLIMARVFDEARRALVFTNASVQAVADTLGFTDAAYFSRAFRKHTGQTPRHYRETERERLRETETGD